MSTVRALLLTWAALSIPASVLVGRFLRAGARLERPGGHRRQGAEASPASIVTAGKVGGYNERRPQVTSDQP